MLTCCNLAAGFYACILALNGNCTGAMLAILIAGVFDFADGLAARTLNARSEIGKDLDSLSDIVSFGAAPAMMLFDFIDRMQHAVEWPHPWWGKIWLAGVFAIPICSALRLAKFNNDERQLVSFIGLPVPAHAIFWASLINSLSPSFAENGFCADLSLNSFSIFEAGIPLQPVVVATTLLAVATSLLLVSPIPMFSLKITSLKWKGNEILYIWLCLSAVSIVCFGVFGATLTIILYILFSIINKMRIFAS